jgi:hypothetical protein
VAHASGGQRRSGGEAVSGAACALRPVQSRARELSRHPGEVGNASSHTKPPTRVLPHHTMSKEQNGDATGSRPEADFAEVQLDFLVSRRGL